MPAHDPFETLGVPRRFRLDTKLLAQRHRDLSRALHPDRYAQAAPAERRAAIERAGAVNEAFRTLKDPYSRAAALLAAAGRPVDEHTRADAGLLGEILELRERLEDLKSQHDAAALEAIDAMRSAIAARVAGEEQVISDAFDAPGVSPGDRATLPEGPALDRAHTALVRLRYLQRFLDEATAVHDDE